MSASSWSPRRCGRWRSRADRVAGISRVAVATGAAVLLGLAPLAATDGPIDRLERLGRTLRSQPAWSASYHQEYVPAGMTMGEEEVGTVWIAWPDRAHFSVGDPMVRVMGMDGRRVRLIDHESATCDDHQIDDDEWSKIPLAAVLDPQAAVDGFVVLDWGAAGVALEPRDPGGVARVEVELGSGGLPSEIVVIDPQGATNRLRFAGWRRAPGPPGGAWLPAAPAGIECVGDEP